jgi:hypothetical protein
VRTVKVIMRASGYGQAALNCHRNQARFQQFPKSKPHKPHPRNNLPFQPLASSLEHPESVFLRISSRPQICYRCSFSHDNAHHTIGRRDGQAKVLTPLASHLPLVTCHCLSNRNSAQFKNRFNPLTTNKITFF